MAAVVWATACGGSGGGRTSEAPLSKAEYAAQANAICAELLKRSPPFPSDFSDLRAVADFFDEAIPLSEELLRKLRELTPPPELANTADERFAFAEEQVALSREARDAARRGDRGRFSELIETAGAQEAKEERFHKELGWTQCS